MTTFSPTHEWQDVPEDAVCPPGLQYELDPNTGLRRARIPPGDPPDPKADARAAFIKAYAEQRKARGPNGASRPDRDALAADEELAARIAALGKLKPDVEPAGPTWRDGRSTADLMISTFLSHKWAVSSILPEGLAVFAGKQKSGKTWLALSLGHAVGTGAEFLGHKCTGGDVLLLLLEDNPRRVQDRMRRMGLPGSERVQIFNTWPGPGKTALAALVDWLEQAIKDGKAPRLIIIDTLKRFLGISSAKGDAYEKSVVQLMPLQQIALAAGTTVLGITHERKDSRSDDWQDRITGSAGILSVADTIISLSRERDKPNALLRVTGRDVQDTEIVLTFQSDTCTWTTLDRHPAVQDALLRARQGAREFLEGMIEGGTTCTADEWAKRRGITRQAADKALRRLELDGAVAKTWRGNVLLWEVRKHSEKT